jgi:hypothetical protein
MVLGLLMPGLVMLGACVSHRPLRPTDLLDLARSYDEPHDAVYDATRLGLERLNFSVPESNRQAGTLRAQLGQDSFDVDVSSKERRSVVTITPRAEQADFAAEASRQEELARLTRQLLDRWREFPEWTFDARSDLVKLENFSANPPRDWAHVDVSVDRRRVTVQKRRLQREGLNPTLLIVVDRRRYDGGLTTLVGEAAGQALTARQRLLLPPALEADLDAQGYHGDVDVLDGSVPRTFRFFAWDVHDDAFSVRLVAVCAKDGEDACDDEWAQVAKSVKSHGFSFAR